MDLKFEVIVDRMSRETLIDSGVEDRSQVNRCRHHMVGMDFSGVFFFVPYCGMERRLSQWPIRPRPVSTIPAMIKGFR